MRQLLWAGGIAFVVVTQGLLHPVQAQTLRGQALDAQDEVTPVPSALVELVDADGETVGVSLTDGEGWFTLQVEEAGEYLIRANALGWEPYESARFSVGGVQAVLRVDLLLIPRPIPLEGLDVDVRQFERLDENLQLDIGLAPASMRFRPIGVMDVRRHAELGRTLTQMIAFEARAGIIVQDRANYVCFQFRRGCLPLFLNGVRVDASAFAPGMPLELLDIVVILAPGETMAYPAGGVLAYSRGWLR